MTEAHTQQFIGRETTVGDILARYPYLSEPLLSYGIHCVGCHVNTMDTLEQGAREFGLSAEQIDQMVEELNELVAQRGEEPVEPPQSDAADFALGVTPKAAAKLTSILQDENKAGWGVRIGVTPGGCAGFSYAMDLEKDPRPDDSVIETAGVRVFVDGKSRRSISGVTIDFVETLQGSGFKFKNPNAKASCGCGKSFA